MLFNAVTRDEAGDEVDDATELLMTESCDDNSRGPVVVVDVLTMRSV